MLETPSRPNPRRHPSPRRLRHIGTLALAVAALVPVAGCSGSKKDKAASQTAARVNAGEVTVHQINLSLQQQRGLPPEQADVASRQILESLIDQELAVQQSRALKLDQDPRVMLQLEAAKREVLARAYAEKSAEAADKPTPEAMRKYYDDKPALFKERRVYSIQELSVDAAPEQVAQLREQAQRAKSSAEVVQYLKATGLRYRADQGVRPAEQLPASVLERLATTQDGQLVLLPRPGGAIVIALVASRAEPADEARALPAIEQFLIGEARRKRVEADLKALRVAAKVEYIGKFAEAPASAAAGGPPRPAAAAPAAASGISAEDIGRGLGLKK